MVLNVQISAVLLTIASDVIKHMTTSNTINIPENTTLYKTLRIIIKNFEATIKNNEIPLKILKISKYPKFI